ncbi:MAG: DNA-directed RNA polymerase subunit alpha [Berkelbacteria bacterium GW2011_GWA1_36_9]|uniref:DNA-directed RNA polymerase subunit alpha n=1 Tax=Berkelbacteria bacterium GW2011_GWA1_36_9 TaxID=1618331 RepID=A0A0G0FGM3_9BACT|nr:MAG: DNA-directed RNA polymerase subunit alpha [Berkelbacteria bacterium GW2011_GWA1_36_9]
MAYTLPETELVKIKTIEQVDNKGIFEVEPLSPGYGVTIGNSLRRILLSSLEGSAITSVKIDGATHQFATLLKVKEDIVEIILNLKTLRFKMNSDEPVVLKLQVKGPKDVTAQDFAENADCKVVNTSAFIANVGKGGTLKMEITVMRGRGYVPIEKRKDEKLPIGTISIDSIFTPVKKVHYEVENTRVGGMTNFDKLMMEITTDGSIEPSVALGTATKILVEHFSLIEKACEADVEVVKTEKAPKKEKVKISKKTVKKVTKK